MVKAASEISGHKMPNMVANFRLRALWSPRLSTMGPAGPKERYCNLIMAADLVRHQCSTKNLHRALTVGPDARRPDDAVILYLFLHLFRE